MRATIIAAGLWVASASAVAAAVQTFPTQDPVLRHIWALGMDSSRVQPLAQVLLDSVGPRLTGTPGHEAGNEWLVRMYREWGVEARIEPYGTWRGWRRGTSHIDLMSPRVRTLEGTMLAWSAGTGGRAVTAEAILLPTLADAAEFERWLPQAAGKYVLLSPPSPSCRPSSDWTQFARPASRAALEARRDSINTDWTSRIRATGFNIANTGPGTLGVRLDRAGVAGVIIANPTDFTGTYRVFQTQNTRSPSVILSCEDYGLVFRLAEAGQAPVLRMTLDAELLGEVPVANVIGRIPGVERPDEYVMLSAHFDSWDGGSGATDNGTGTLVMMEAMRILKLAYPQPKRTILVGHWGGEEQGLIGSRAWTEDHPEVLAGLQALFNQDNGTGRIRSVNGSGGLVGIDQHLQKWRAQLPAPFSDTIQFNAPARVPGAPSGSDGAVFSCKGTPSFSLGALSWNYNQETWHTNRDTYDKVVFDDVRWNATLTAMLAYLAAEDPELISRTRLEGNWPNCGMAPRRSPGP